jgi:hypothetical protein
MYKYISNCRAVPCLFIFFYTPAGKYSFMYMHATLFSSNVYKLLLESDLRACDYCTRKKKEYLRVESINSKIFPPLATNPHTQFYLEGHVTSSLCALSVSPFYHRFFDGILHLTTGILGRLCVQNTTQLLFLQTTDLMIFLTAR